MSLVALCVPHGGKIEPEFNRRVMTMQGQFMQHTFIHTEIDLMIIGKARNVLVEEVLSKSAAEVLWFLDNDVLIPPHAGVLIEQALQYNIVSGLYFNRHTPYTPQIYKLSQYSGEEGLYESIVDYPDQGFLKVDAVGAGCLAIKREVLEAMRDSHLAKTADTRELLEGAINGAPKPSRALQWVLRYAETLSPWFEFLDQKGEDFYFCERAADNNFMIWANIDVKCEHRGSLDIQEGHFKYLLDQGLLVRLDPQGNPMDERLPEAQSVVTESQEVPNENLTDSLSRG